MNVTDTTYSPVSASSVAAVAQSTLQNQQNSVAAAVTSATGDSVNLSTEALIAAQKVKPLADPESAVPISWGPDLLEGWNDPNYLKNNGINFSGSLSFTTATGTRVGVQAIPHSDGVMVTAQTIDGKIYQSELHSKETVYTPATTEDSEGRLIGTHFFTGGAIRITETENGIEFIGRAFGDSDNGWIMDQALGTEDDDIIITFDWAVGKGGNDTIIGLGSGNCDGGEGDDTIVDIASSPLSNRSIDAGSGNDTVYLRSVTDEFWYQSHKIDLGAGDDTLLIDRMPSGTLTIDPKGDSKTIKIGQLGQPGGWSSNVEINILAGESTDKAPTSLDIGVAYGKVHMHDGNLRLRIMNAINANIVSEITKANAVSINRAENSRVVGDNIAVDYAENSILFGNNITVKNNVDSLITNNVNMYYEASVLGVQPTLRLLRQYGESFWQQEQYTEIQTRELQKQQEARKKAYSEYAAVASAQVDMQQLEAVV